MEEQITYDEMIEQLLLCKLLMNGIVRDLKIPKNEYEHIKRYAVQRDITKLRKELSQLSRLVKVFNSET